MSEFDTSLKRNTDTEVLPEAYSDELSDYVVLRADENGHTKISDFGEAVASPSVNTLLGRIKKLEDKLGEVQDAPTANTLLARIKSLEDKIDNLTDTDGNLKVSQNGSNLALSDTPATGTKTVTSTAAEIFAGGSRKTGRSMMYIRNNHDSIAIRIGASDITDSKGRRILPDSEEKIEFDPLSDVALYAISEFGNVEVEVFEA